MAATQAFALQTNDQLMTAEGFNDYILANRSGTFATTAQGSNEMLTSSTTVNPNPGVVGVSGPVRVRDVGRAIVGPQDVNLAGWMNTEPAIIIAVQRQSGANVIATVDAIKKALPQLEASLPPSLKIHIVSDRTQTIRASVADVQNTLLLTIGLVVGVILLFLRKLWATVIPAISVPMSLIGTFTVMYVLGYSLDNLSLMALTIAVGFVVDDAIVMIENIVRHIEEGKTPMQAALQGAGEIGFTIMSISISLIAVFIPLFLMSGIVGLLFREFAVTVAVAILVSVIVSLTLTPMMCARLLTAEGDTRPGLISRTLERFFEWLAAVYDRGLVVALRHRLITLLVMIATVALTGVLFVEIPKGFFPQEDTGLIQGIAEGAENISPQAMKDRMRAVLAVVMKDPAVAAANAYIGPGGPTVTENDGRVFITLKPLSQRVGVDQVIARLNKALQPVWGITLYMQAAQDITIGARVSKTQYQYTLVDVDIDELDHWAPILFNKLKTLPQLTDVASDQQSTGRVLKVEIDRQLAQQLGINPSVVDSILYDAFGQRVAARIYTRLNQYFVILEVEPDFQLGPNALSRIYATSVQRQRSAAERVRQDHLDGGADCGQPPGPIPIGNVELQPPSECLYRRGGDGDPAGHERAAPAGFDCDELPGQRAGVSEFAEQHADPDPRRIDRGLHHPRHALREHDPPDHDHLDLALGRARRAADPDAVRHAARRDRHHRDHPADRHRQEERHHAGRLRAGRPARARAQHRGGDPRGVPVCAFARF